MRRQYILVSLKKYSKAVKDTCKQAIFRKDTRRAKRVVDLWTAGDQDKGELEFFNMLINIWLNI